MAGGTATRGRAPGAAPGTRLRGTSPRGTRGRADHGRGNHGFGSLLRGIALGAVCALTAACGLLGGDTPPEEAIRVTPDDGARGVRAGAPLEVSVAEGRLDRVRVIRKGDAAHQALPGRVSADGRTWRLAPEHGRLALASKYTVDAVAYDEDGRRTARHTDFTTWVPEHRFIGFFTPEHRQTVGTGMIVSIDFNRPIADRAAVERAVSVRAEPAVEVAPHWFGRSRLDFRPRTYWRPGTRVTLSLRLRDVRAAPGVYGVQHKQVRFTVGRDQSSVVDAAGHTMTVRRGGVETARIPVTAGTDRNPTYNGHMVITEKYDVTRMDGRTVGFGGEYDIKDVPHAMRLTDSGTFLHGNYWADKGVFGTDNISHGCVGLPDEKGGSADSPAGSFFRSSLVGDLVTVTGSAERTVSPDNGLGGWNMSWPEWKAGSARD